MMMQLTAILTMTMKMGTIKKCRKIFQSDPGFQNADPYSISIRQTKADNK